MDCCGRTINCISCINCIAHTHCWRLGAGCTLTFSRRSPQIPDTSFVGMGARLGIEIEIRHCRLSGWRMIPIPYSGFRMRNGIFMLAIKLPPAFRFRFVWPLAFVLFYYAKIWATVATAIAIYIFVTLLCLLAIVVALNQSVVCLRHAKAMPPRKSNTIWRGWSLLALGFRLRFSLGFYGLILAFA